MLASIRKAVASTNRDAALVHTRRPPLLRAFVFQGIALLLVTICLGWVSRETGVAFVCGALIGLVEQAYFAKLAFRFFGASRTNEVVRSFYRGETGKFVIAIVGFACVFMAIPAAQQSPVWVFIGYGSQWLMHVVLMAKTLKSSDWVAK